MEVKHFNMLAVAAVISLVTAGLVHSAYDTWTAESVTGEKLFPGFGDDVNRVSEVALQQGKQVFTFKKNGDQWTFVERGGYPVNAKKVRELLVRIATAELVEAKTRDPERYGLLELGDAKKDDAKSALVKLTDNKGNEIAELVIGKSRESAFGAGKSGSYVRRPGINQTWLSNVELKASFAVADWVDPVFFRFDTTSVSSLTLTTPDGGDVKLIPDDKKDGDFKFAAIPEGKQPKSGVDASVMVRGVKTLELTDVNAAGAVKGGKDSSAIPVVLETKDNMKLQLTVLKIGEDDRWVSVKVLEDGKDAKRAKQLKDNLAGWQFKIADWRSRQIFKTYAEIFEDEVKLPGAEAKEKPVTAPAVNSPTQN
ncbi:MAG: DUF4340 domain-containing protein [Hyphomicrobiaceae bacterium]